jgi:hypothetical protein
MVHALEEIRRVLVRDGILIDLRPLADGWPIEVITARGREQAGRVTDPPQALEEDAAANDAMARGEQAGLLRRDREELFPFHYTWDSPREMQEYLEQEWEDFAGIEEAAWQRIRSAWALAGADARVGIGLKMLITRWIRAE